jgi:membrane-bound lytic murein transglycosylase D
VVQRGETLFGVARRYGLSTAQLTAANPGIGINLKVDQVIQIPQANATGARTARVSPHPEASSRTQKQKLAKAKPTRYTVKRGDTLHDIAQRFDISLSEIKAWNPALKKNGHVRAGQTVVVDKT